MPDLLTTEDLLAQLHISPKTLNRHIARGLLPAPLRIGRRRYWEADRFELALRAPGARKAVKPNSSETGHGQ